MTLSTSTMERAHDELMDDAPSLPAKPERRRFSAAYKLAMLDKYDACTGDGDKGALLRREGLYSSQITEWRRSREAGALVGLRTQPRRDQARPLSAELARATRRAERAEAKLAKAQKVIEIQGKVTHGARVGTHRCEMKSWRRYPLDVGDDWRLQARRKV